mgnify:CR=1 FL=1|jgi:hypothetical protein
MALGRLWAGNVFGTNTGKVFLQLSGEDTALTGTLRFNEDGVGIVLYSVSGKFDGRELTLTGEPQTQIEGYVFGRLTAIATVSPRGTLEGEWETEIGSAGTFILYRHERPQAGAALDGSKPDQLHTARYHFDAIEIDREQLIALAEEIQQDFTDSPVVVTVVARTEQSRYLPDFKSLTFNEERAEVAKLYVQERGPRDLDRIVSVEFGPQVNVAMTQGADEAWVLGMLEKLKGYVRPYERSYATNIKRLGFGINQVLAAGTIVVLPGIATLFDRAILVVAVIALMAVVVKLHNHYLPFAAIYLRAKPNGLASRIAPTLLSWLIAVTASVAASLIAAYLQGSLGLPN